MIEEDDYVELYVIKKKTCFSWWYIIFIFIFISVAIPGGLLIARGVNLIKYDLKNTEWDNCTIRFIEVKNISTSGDKKCRYEVIYNLRVDIIHPIYLGDYYWNYVRNFTCSELDITYEK